MPAEILRFEDFELDRSAYELRRGGSIVHLERIPFDLLNLLVERHGQMVTRQEILEQIWGKDVYVDADNSINTAVRKIRQALHDNPEKPRFVVTIPAKGYRFVARLEKPLAPPAEITRKDVFVDGDNGNNTPVAKTRLALKEDPESPRFLQTVPERGYQFAPEPLVEKARDAATDGRVGFPGAGGSLLRRRWTLWVALGSLVVIGITAVLLGLNVHDWRGRLSVRAEKPRIQALAVLPLANLSRDPEQEYFADGMTEALITELGKISSPRVISRQSIMQYKDSKRPLQEIARELNVDAVLEGTVERSGDRVRVTVRLEQVSPEGQLWSNQYNRDIRDMLGLQDEIARTVTDEIRVKLKPQEYARVGGSPPVNPEVQDLYFRALYFRDKGAITTHYSEQDLVTAISYFGQAIEKDSKYAPAYAGMAAAYIELGNPWSGSHPAKETQPLAKAAATRAVELDPLLGEAHFVLAQTAELGEWNWSEAERQYKLALELSPNYAPAHEQHGRFLQALGRNDEALKEVAYSAELSPMDLSIRDVMGLVTLEAGQSDSAIAQFKELNAAYPGLGDFGLGWCYREKKMYPEAIAALERGVGRRRDPVPLASLACVYGLAGRKREALKLIDELEERSRHHYVPEESFAEAYFGLGDKDEAIARLERAFEAHDQGMVWLKAYLLWEPLHSDPRFQALLRRMNFPP